ncbi:hypothetical protein [Halobaculum gomorrense]|uniref:DUF7967 domain-containing protein n=1 Tax=Halobaculum gomorrense TaxID=43928 RepID=A0A1M5U0V0_9EURY|nr:hypothetical protein [Halobaculum gomorrense]SHH56490.1 hypothetical protein SAMN05443636_2866 [Halobaculum gomorrense]
MSSADSREGGDSESVRVWLVERTYGDDELNIVILVYADETGRRYFRKERALTSFTDERETPVSQVVPADELGRIDELDRERYAAEAARMAAAHDPDDAV